MNNTYYSPSEKILFWIAGYTLMDNTNNVVEQIKSLSKDLSSFSTFAKVSPDKVNTFFCEESSHYKYMRVFYCETKEVPEGVFKLDDDWTMIKWIKN